MIRMIEGCVITLCLQLGCMAIGPERREEYNYASEQAWDICVDSCPGENCLCILGAENTWYVSPEVGE